MLLLLKIRNGKLYGPEKGCITAIGWQWYGCGIHHILSFLRDMTRDRILKPLDKTHYSVPRCDATEYSRQVPAIWRNLLLPWRWNLQVPSECWELCTRLHGVTSQNTTILVYWMECKSQVLLCFLFSACRKENQNQQNKIPTWKSHLFALFRLTLTIPRWILLIYENLTAPNTNTKYD